MTNTLTLLWEKSGEKWLKVIKISVKWVTDESDIAHFNVFDPP